MKHFLNLFKYEIRSLFLSPATYASAIFFLLLMGLLYLIILWSFSGEEKDALPSAIFFQLFWIPVFFIVPLLTMKSMAEERRLGTLETLMTTPVTIAEIVLSKFLAVYFFYCLLWLLTLGFPVLATRALGESLVGNRLLDSATLIGGYLFVTVSGLLFIAVGIFASSLTRSQLVASMLSFSILFMIVLGPPIIFNQATSWPAWLEVPLNYLHIFNHLEDFKRGVIDSRSLIYYLGNAILVLVLSVLVAESKI